MTVRHLLRDDDLTPDEQDLVLRLAERLSADSRAALGLQAGTAVGLYFEKPSLRTRVSADVACMRIGAHPVLLRQDELQVGHRETVDDTARVLGGYLGLLMARVFSHETLEALTAPEAMHIVNGLCDRFHPLQALADLLTLRQEWGSVAGRTLAYVGDGNNVASSLLLAGAMAEMHVVVATPAGYEPESSIVADATALARVSGGEVSVIEDPHEAAIGADVLYTDVWTSMGQEDEQVARMQAFGHHRISAELVAHAREGAVVLHCLPAHRGEEITAEVLEGPASRVFPQAHNRMPAAAAAFLFLLDPDEAERVAGT